MQKKCSFADISSQLMPDYLAQLVTKHNSRQIESLEYVFNSILVLIRSTNWTASELQRSAKGKV